MRGWRRISHHGGVRPRPLPTRPPLRREPTTRRSKTPEECRLCALVGGGLQVLGQCVDTLFGVGLRKTGVHRDDVNQIGAIIAAQRTIGDSRQQNARDFLTRRFRRPASPIAALSAPWPRDPPLGAFVGRDSRRGLFRLCAPYRSHPELVGGGLHLSENPVDSLFGVYSAASRRARRRCARHGCGRHCSGSRWSRSRPK